ncbi:hypothetical protein RvY_01374 [Ramazzottius varieornatus]|uniref:CARMIL C-terminal domain-containing protein n=1 Tax=Ramazzottius varieornatus TaxID=947166 RepID=A0A1D1UK21_RAMVA|nr:hypothetical protein RvY_01374 [Ramazzottius varieornatus]
MHEAPLVSSMASSVLQKLDDSSRMHGDLSSDDSDAYLSTSSSYQNGQSPDAVEDESLTKQLLPSVSEAITDKKTDKATTSGAVSAEQLLPGLSHPTDSSPVTEPKDGFVELDETDIKDDHTTLETDRKADVRHPLEAEDDPSQLEKFLSDDLVINGPEATNEVLEDPLGAHLKEKKKNKTVTFRGEDATDLVTEFVDAPDPWHYGAESSTQKVLESYAKMCLHYNVQPLPKVLEAIKRNPGGGQRSGTFDVSGENLTLNLIDTFEPIFMRMCFEELNLTNCLPNDDVAVSIMDMLEYYQMADKLVISSNRKLEFRAWLTIAKVLKKSGIYYLDVSDCLLQEASASLLTRALRIGTNLVTLHIEKCGLSGRALFLLISALQYSENVQELFLGDNKLSPNDVIHIASAFKHGWKLRVLDLRNNTIMDAGATHLLDALEDGGVRGGSLRALNLWNNFLTSNIARSLSQLLARSRLLETLNLGLNDLKDETVFTIKQSLMMNRGLRRLGLQSTSMSDEGCIALAEYLADQPRFLRLDVRYNEIKAGGWLALSHATKLCPSLIRVDMSYDTKHLTHSDTIRDTMRVIHEACQANRERFDKGTAPSAEKEPEEPKPEKYSARINKLFGAGASNDDVAIAIDDVAIAIDDVDKPVDSSEAAGDASRTEKEQTLETGSKPVDNQLTSSRSTTEADSALPLDDGSSQDFPVFLGSLGNDANSTLELDVPRKKGQEMALRRSSITSLTASGPLSVSDRLADELFPVRVHPIPQASNHVTKGRFHISLVKATEKIYQSVQSVLSPTGSAVMAPMMGAHTTPPSENPPDGAKGIFNNWRASFRRGSKDGIENGGSLISPAGDNEGKRLNGDSKKSPDRSDNVQIGSSGETTKDAVVPSLPVLQT